MNPEITDQTLVLQRLKEGDEKTFELLFHRYYAALCFFANKILKDEEAARDVVQEVFIRFYEKSYDFPNLIALKSFLYSCVQSKALNALEKQNTRTFPNMKKPPISATRSKRRYSRKFLLPLKNCLPNAGGFSK